MTSTRHAQPSWSFRPAASADVSAVVALVESAYRGASSRQGWTTEAHLLGGQRTDREEIAAAVADPSGQLLLAQAGDGDLVGCCRVERREQTAYFGTFAVRPDQQGWGLGRVLLGEAERVVAGWGAAGVEMTVIRQRADLIAWYERRGYARTGEARPFPYGDERFGQPLVDDLEFVVLAKALPTP